MPYPYAASLKTSRRFISSYTNVKIASQFGKSSQDDAASWSWRKRACSQSLDTGRCLVAVKAWYRGWQPFGLRRRFRRSDSGFAAFAVPGLDVKPTFSSMGAPASQMLAPGKLSFFSIAAAGLASQHAKLLGARTNCMK